MHCIYCVSLIVCPHISYSDHKLPNRTMLMTCAVCFGISVLLYHIYTHQHLQNITDSKLIPLCLDLYTLSASSPLSPLFILSPPSSPQPIPQHPLKPLKTTTITVATANCQTTFANRPKQPDTVQPHRLTDLNESVEASHSRYVQSHPRFLSLCQFNRVL